LIAAARPRVSCRTISSPAASAMATDTKDNGKRVERAGLRQGYGGPRSCYMSYGDSLLELS
jgi:hypothetical protein